MILFLHQFTTTIYVTYNARIILLFIVFEIETVFVLERNYVEAEEAKFCKHQCSIGVAYMTCPPTGDKKLDTPSCISCCKAPKGCKLFNSDDSLIYTYWNLMITFENYQKGKHVLYFESIMVMYVKSSLGLHFTQMTFNNIFIYTEIMDFPVFVKEFLLCRIYDFFSGIFT